MTAGQVVRTLRVAPFQPFYNHLVDGRSILIRHPELITLSGGGRIATVRINDGWSEAIVVLMIVSLRPTDDPHP
jgi:hypothetical protein